MNKFMIAAIAACTMVVASTQAHAMTNKQAAYLFGGIAGGMVLGELLAPRPNVYAAPPVYAQPAPVYVQPAPVVVYEEPLYRKVCARRWVRIYDPNRNEYIKIRRKSCEMVPVN